MKSLMESSLPLTDIEVLHVIFETQADQRPEAVAVVFGREQTTYAELESRANRLARHLRGRGVGRRSVVAMMLPRAIEAYSTLLGILKTGAAYVPIDPEYPADRVAYILEDSDAEALVTTLDLASRHRAFGGAVVRVDADRDAIAAESPARLRSEEAGVGGRDLCYVIYTSGSMGRPKGVMIEHRSACHLVRAEGRIFGVRPEDRVYQGSSLSFDLSVEEVWLAFHAGATLVAATPEMAHAGPDLSQLLTECGVTVLSSVPTLLAMLKEDVPTLRLLILGGEACPDRVVARWARPGRRVVNTYGPTETTVIATYTDLSPDKPVTIGRAVPGYPCTSSTTDCGRSLAARWARSASAAPALRAGTWDFRSGRASGSYRTHSHRTAKWMRGSTARAIWDASTRTATSSSSAVGTRR